MNKREIIINILPIFIWLTLFIVIFVLKNTSLDLGVIQLYLLTLLPWLYAVYLPIGIKKGKLWKAYGLSAAAQILGFLLESILYLLCISNDPESGYVISTLLGIEVIYIIIAYLIGYCLARFIYRIRR